MLDPSLTRGVASVLAACCIWSLSLIAPELVGVGAIGVVAARYLGGGIPSAVLLRRGVGHGERIEWRRAFTYAATGQIGYYIVALIAVSLAGAPMVMGIVGMTPVLMAMADRRVAGQPIRPLALPLAGSVSGLLLLGSRQIAAPPESSSALAVAAGVTLAIVGMGAWIWYGIDNARHLRAHPELTSARWASATSVASMIMATPAIFIVATSTPAAGLPPLLLVALFIGVGGSWLAVIAFGQGSRHLPPGLSGQLLVTETLLSLGVVAAIRGIVPDGLTLLAVAILLSSVLVAVRSHGSTRGPAGTRRLKRQAVAEALPGVAER